MANGTAVISPPANHTQNQQRTLRIPAMRFKQGSRTLYMFPMNAAAIGAAVMIDRYNSKRPISDANQGYQRPEDKSRPSKIAKFLSGTVTRIMPTAIVTCSRSKLNYDEGLGELSIDSVLYLVDGQHRIAGIARAIEIGVTFEDFEIPVVVIDGGDKLTEMAIFATVNGEAKGVRVDLVRMIQAHRHSIVGDAGIDKKDHCRVSVTKAVERLSLSDKSGIWRGKIIMPDQVGSMKFGACASEYVIRATSMIQAIMPVMNYLNDNNVNGFASLSIDEKTDIIVEIVQDFWKAMRRINPEVFKKPMDYLLQKTTGLVVSHRFLVELLGRLRKVNKTWSVSEFENMLSRFPQFADADFWKCRTGDAAPFGGNEGHHLLCRLIRKSEKSS